MRQVLNEVEKEGRNDEINNVPQVTRRRES